MRFCSREKKRTSGNIFCLVYEPFVSIFLVLYICFGTCIVRCLWGDLFLAHIFSASRWVDRLTGASSSGLALLLHCLILSLLLYVVGILRFSVSYGWDFLVGFGPLMHDTAKAHIHLERKG